MNTITSTSLASAMRPQRGVEMAEPAAKPGKSAASVGHMAKAKIAEAASEQAMPANIQGKVASALARGLPVDSLLALQQDTGSSATETVDIEITTSIQTVEVADETALDLLEADQADETTTAT